MKDSDVPDGLVGIAERECQNRDAANSLFQANHDRPQKGGGSIRSLGGPVKTGWMLILDCSGVVTDPAPTVATAEYGRRILPAFDSPAGQRNSDHLITLKQPTRAAVAKAEECGNLQSTMTPKVYLPTVAPGSKAASEVVVFQGSIQHFRAQGFASAPTAELVSASRPGRRVALSNIDALSELELYADPRLPAGHYQLTASDGEHVGYRNVEIRPAEHLDLVRPPTGAANRYDIVGGADSVDVAIYWRTSDACEFQFLQRSDGLGLTNGVGSLTINRGRATPGGYCIRFRNREGSAPRGWLAADTDCEATDQFLLL